MNFDNKKEFDKEKNVYLSLLQDFGPVHGTDEGTVTIRSRKITRENQEHQQIVVIAKGFDCQTYSFLDSAPVSEERQLIQRSIEQLKKSVEFCDKDRKEKDRRFLAVKEGFFTLGLTEEYYRKKWEAERSKFGSPRNQPDKDVEMTDVQPVLDSEDTEMEFE